MILSLLLKLGKAFAVVFARLRALEELGILVVDVGFGLLVVEGLPSWLGLRLTLQDQLGHRPNQAVCLWNTLDRSTVEWDWLCRGFRFLLWLHLLLDEVIKDNLNSKRYQGR